MFSISNDQEIKNVGCIMELTSYAVKMLFNEVVKNSISCCNEIYFLTDFSTFHSRALVFNTESIKCKLVLHLKLPILQITNSNQF